MRRSLSRAAAARWLHFESASWGNCLAVQTMASTRPQPKGVHIMRRGSGQIERCGDGPFCA